MWIINRNFANVFQAKDSLFMDENQMASSKKILRRKLDLLLRTGQILMESSADTNRVKRNMERTAAYLGLPKENLHMDIGYYLSLIHI